MQDLERHLERTATVRLHPSPGGVSPTHICRSAPSYPNRPLGTLLTMTTATLTRPARTTGGPLSGTWFIDTTRAMVAFSGKASFLAPTINARFLGVEGSVEVAETSRGLAGAVDVSVDVTSMTSGNKALGRPDRLVRPLRRNTLPGRRLPLDARPVDRWSGHDRRHPDAARRNQGGAAFGGVRRRA